MTTYIGLDAHSKTCVFFGIDRRGRKLFADRVETTEASILKFIRGIKGAKALAVEESGIAQWVFLLLRNEVDELVVCDAAALRRRRSAKTDFNDAEGLAQGLRANDLVAVHHEDSPLSELRVVVSAYRDVVRDMVRIKNRYKALYRANALSATGSAIYSDSARLAELKRLGDRFVAERLQQQIEDFEELKKAYLLSLETAARKNRLIRNLMTIPGISTVRACMIAAAVCTAERFQDKHHFWSYCMLVRHPQISDGRSYGSRKVAARSDLKEVFMGAAESNVQGTSGLRAHYDQMRAKGLDDRKAKKALARKIAAIALVMMRKESVYVDCFEEKQLERIEKASKHLASAR